MLLCAALGMIISAYAGISYKFGFEIPSFAEMTLLWEGTLYKQLTVPKMPGISKIDTNQQSCPRHSV